MAQFDYWYLAGRSLYWLYYWYKTSKYENYGYRPSRKSTSRPRSNLGYGPIYGSGHECQFTPHHNKFSLNYQYSTFEEASRFCKERMNICGIIVELTLKGTLIPFIRLFRLYAYCITLILWVIHWRSALL